MFGFLSAAIAGDAAQSGAMTKTKAGTHRKKVFVIVTKPSGRSKKGFYRLFGPPQILSIQDHSPIDKLAALFNLAI
jgi:hypothetical protein